MFRVAQILCLDKVCFFVSYWLALMRGTFTCVGWQVTLRDLIWQVTSHGCEMGVHINSYALFYLLPLPFNVLHVLWFRYCTTVG